MGRLGPLKEGSRESSERHRQDPLDLSSARPKSLHSMTIPEHIHGMRFSLLRLKVYSEA